jgi:hypothetical protein
MLLDKFCVLEGLQVNLTVHAVVGLHLECSAAVDDPNKHCTCAIMADSFSTGMLRVWVS